MTSYTMVLFGASGDLSARKIIPTLYHMLRQSPDINWALVGAAHEQLTVTQMLERAIPFIDSYDEDIFKKLIERSYYVTVDVHQSTHFDTLFSVVTDVEKRHNLSGSRIIYCATAQSLYCQITVQAARTELAFKCAQSSFVWCRLVYEKPFGHNLESARAINVCIKNYFYEHQIYRVDHYLSKQLVRSIALVRFSNALFEPLWNANYIKEIQIIMNESIDIANRGAYYDNHGAIADVVQNHLLELLSLVAMETPARLSGDDIREQRAHVLSCTRVTDVLRGQYQGYTTSSYVDINSTTETFATLALAVDNARWQNVPFYIKTGKALSDKVSVIHVVFKAPVCLLTRSCPPDSNYLSLYISDDEGISITFNTAGVDDGQEIMPITLQFNYSQIPDYQPIDPYMTLIFEIIRGDQSVAVRFDEIEYAWSIIDNAHVSTYPIYIYEKNSRGPRELEIFEQQHAMRWLS